MNMISTGAFLNEMDASNKQPTVAEQFAAVWEKKNAKAARAGGVSLMALSLAACGSSSTTSTTTSSTTTTTTTATPAAKVFTLTLNEDSGAAFVGGDGADTFNGGAIQNNAGTTGYPLQAFDQLDGGAGDDTLNVTLNTTVAPKLTSIETVNAKAVANSTLNMASSTGATKLVNADSTANMSFTNVASVAAVEISGLAGGSNTTVGYATDVLKGTADSQSLTLGGNTSMGAISIGESGAKVETLNVSVAGENVGTSLTSGAKDIVITGSGDLKLTTAVVGNVNASAATGKMELTADADSDTITLGSGADKLTISDANTVTLEATVNMGGGADSLVITNLNGVADLVDDKVTLNGGDGEDSITMLAALGAGLSGLSATAYAKKGISGFEKAIISDQVDDQTLNFDQMGVSSVDFVEGLKDSNAITVSDKTNIELSKAADATGDTATITVKGAGVAGSNDDELTLTLNAAHAAATTQTDLGVVSVANVETVNIVSKNATTATTLTTGNNTMDLIAVHMKTLNITGDTALNILADPLEDAIETINAADFTGISLVASVAGANGAVKITMGGTTDLTFTGSSNADTIVGAGGDDIIDGGGGKDVITTGAGTDKITIADGAFAAASQIIVTDFDVTKDTINIDEDLADAGSGTYDIRGGLAAGEYQEVSTAQQNLFTQAANSAAIELAYEFDHDVDLDDSTVTLADFVSAAGAADNATADSKTAATTMALEHASAEIMIIAYQDSNAYLIEIRGDTADTDLTDGTDGFDVVAILQGVDVGTLTNADFV